MTTITDDRLIAPTEAAEILGVTEATLAVWRCTRRYNLPFVRVGRRVKYRRSAIEKFINDRTFGD